MAKKQSRILIYWDSCNFISLVNENEIDRAQECQKILEDAENGLVQVVTSALSIAEVIRPKGINLSPDDDQKIADFF